MMIQAHNAIISLTCVTKMIFHNRRGHLRTQKASKLLAAVALLQIRLEGFCQTVEKNIFSVVKIGLAKTVFAGKNRFLTELV